MRDLSQAYSLLNLEQQEAVTHPGDTVVLAGPGSGKTDTLTVKVAHLLATEIRAPQGLACITFGREAVAEFAHRLADFGVRSSRRVYQGTVHAFCIDCVIRPFASLVGLPDLAARRVASKDEADRLCEAELNRRSLYPGTFKPEITRIRRAVACGESVDGYDKAVKEAAVAYNRALAAQGLLDFEGMVLAALRLIERYEIVRELLAARFAWLVVDEYQDLGGPLHRIVSVLRTQAGIKVFAVGDPHQTIYDFTGASPRYLEELATAPGVRAIQLRLNYRSGRRLIDASQAVLALTTPLDYGTPPSRTDPGEVLIHDVSGGIDAQLRLVVEEVIPTLRAAGTPFEQIAILYSQRGTVDMLRETTRVLDAVEIPYNAERDDAFPRGPLVRWLQRAAAWTLKWSEGQADGVAFADLAREYRRLGRAAGEDLDRAAGRHRREHLFQALTTSAAPEAPVGPWLIAMEAELELRSMLKLIPSKRDDLDDLELLLRAAARSLPLTLVEFAADGRLIGRVVITTYHSSKGRQFDAVILPGVQEGLAPRRRWNWRANRFYDVDLTKLPEERRLFYVALTRARRWAHLLASPSYTTSKGVAVPLGPSRFLDEVRERLTRD